MAGNIQDSFLKASVKHTNHPRVLIIGEVCKKNPQFDFRYVDENEILKEILNLDASKGCQDSDVPSRIIKENANIFTEFLHFSFKNLIYWSRFPSIPKLANITPVFKNGDINSKDNYRPLSILSKISKFFERCMSHQISNFMDFPLAK